MDINDKIAANIGLVYQQLARFKLTNDQDAESFAYEALYRAILTYDDKAGNAFSTYAVCCIANALRKHLRHINRKNQLSVISYDELLPGEDRNARVLDMILCVNDAEAEVLFAEFSDFVRDAWMRVYTNLVDNHRKAIRLWYLSGYRMTQREIADAMHVSQATVSRALSIFKHRLKVELEEYM